MLACPNIEDREGFEPSGVAPGTLAKCCNQPDSATHPFVARRYASTAFAGSITRESNPHHNFGRVVCCQLTPVTHIAPPASRAAYLPAPRSGAGAESVTGLEPVTPTWQAGALPTTPHRHVRDSGPQLGAAAPKTRATSESTEAKQRIELCLASYQEAVLAVSTTRPY